VALDAVHAAQHRGTSWSELVHDATRVAVAAGRTVDVARWQLSAVRAAVAAGHARATCAPGAMMSVVGAVQALCVQDLLPTRSSRTWSRPAGRSCSSDGRRVSSAGCPTEAGR
jgi:hypothetical protein